MSQNRQLVAIMFTDIFGYTSMMSEDVDSAFAMLERSRQIQRPTIESYHGTWLKEMGDGVLASFTTVTDAVRCAQKIQEICHKDPEIQLRIGIHQGEVILDEGDVFGDGVNIASRIESIAPVGGILVSESVAQIVRSIKDIETRFLCERHLKNVPHSIKLYEVAVQGKFISGMNTDLSSQPQKTVSYFRRGRLLTVLATIFMATIVTMAAVLTRRNFLANNHSENLSIAVLPFDNMSGEDNSIFSAGVTEDIHTQISKIKDLTVLSSFTLRNYNTEGKSLGAIGEELNVAYILIGNLRRSNETVRINCELISTENGVAIWKDSYDRQLQDIFEIQSDISKSVAKELKVQLTTQEVTRIEQIPTDNIEAYNLFLRGNYQLSQRNKDANEIAIGLYKRALGLDPHFALAQAALANAYSRASMEYGSRSYDFLDSALIIATQSTTENPELAMPWLVRGTIYAYKGDLSTAKTMLRKALDITPNHTGAMNNLGNILSQQGHVEEAIQYFDQCIVLYPLGMAFYQNLGDAYVQLELDSKAMEQYEIHTRLHPNPNGFFAHAVHADRLINMGRIEDVAQHVKRMIDIDPKGAYPLEIIGEMSHYYDDTLANKYFEWSINAPDYNPNWNWWTPVGLGDKFMRQGSEERANELLNTSLSIHLKAIEEGSKDQNRFVMIITIYAIKNDLENSLAWLKKLIDSGYMNHRKLTLDPWLSNLHSNDRFKEIIIELKNEIQEIRERVQDRDNHSTI